MWSGTFRTIITPSLLGNSHKTSWEPDQEECQTAALETLLGLLLGWDEGLVSAVVKAQVFTAAE